MPWIIKTTDDENIEAPNIRITNHFVIGQAQMRKKTMIEHKYKLRFWKKPWTETVVEDIWYDFYGVPIDKVHSILWIDHSNKKADHVTEGG